MGEYTIRYNLGPMKGKGYSGLPSTGSIIIFRSPVRATPRGAQLPIGVAGLLCTGVSRPWTPGKIVGPSINCSISLGMIDW